MMQTCRMMEKMGSFKVIVCDLESVSRETGRKQREVFLSLIARWVEMHVTKCEKQEEAEHSGRKMF